MNILKKIWNILKAFVMGLACVGTCSSAALSAYLSYCSAKAVTVSSSWIVLWYAFLMIFFAAIAVLLVCIIGFDELTATKWKKCVRNKLNESGNDNNGDPEDTQSSVSTELKD